MELKATPRGPLLQSMYKGLKIFILNATDKVSTDSFRQKSGMACTVLPGYVRSFDTPAVSVGRG